jgi:DNA-directed RNA polymerase specialized sigma24 family protein
MVIRLVREDGGAMAMRDEHECSYRDYVAARMPDLRRIAFRVCGDWHLAEDAVSNAFAKLYANWHRVRQVEQIDAYARTTVLRSVIDERRRPWRLERTQGDWTAADEPESDAADGVHDRMVLLNALRALGCSVGNVKSQTARGLATLRDAFPLAISPRTEGTHDR